MRPLKKSLHQTDPLRMKGMTLIEIMIVITIIVSVYSIALPNLGLNTGTDVAARLGRLNEDVRAAYDLSILSGKPCRLVFHLAKGTYWLEVTDDGPFYLTDLSSGESELSKEKDEEFEKEFARYKELAEETFTNPENDQKITTSSPVLEAKNKLKGPKWHKHNSLEWTERSFGPNLGLRSIKTQHHSKPVTAEEMGEDATASLYFLPQGYVEKAVLYIYYKISDRQFDMTQNPYKLVTLPRLGEGRIDAVSKDKVDLNDWELHED